VPFKRIQIESRVERFERLLQCEKLIPLDALKPVARKVLKSLHRNGRGRVRAAMDRTMINDTINLLFITVAYGGRALPLSLGESPARRQFGLEAAAAIAELVRGVFARRGAPTHDHHCRP
jgi:hypothetical protein